jgi:hypothetical protein
LELDWTDIPFTGAHTASWVDCGVCFVGLMRDGNIWLALGHCQVNGAAVMLPMRPRHIQRQTYGYTRQGTTTPVRRAGDRHRQGHRRKPRHRHTEFLAFLKQAA